MLEIADVSGDIIDYDQLGCPKVLIQVEQGDFEVQIPLAGDHNAMNALAATACALALGRGIADIKQGLSVVKGVAGRMTTISMAVGAKIIDDTYNANPGSVKAALKYLANMSGKRILALGDMGELGAEAEFYHRQIGTDAKRLGIDKLYTCGELTAVTSEAFGEGAQHFSDIAQLITALEPEVSDNAIILIKGSRAAKMERVVAALI